MITRHTRGKTTWVDLESPTDDELVSIMNEFQVDEHVREEIQTPSPFPLTIAFPGYCYLILHFPTADPSEGARTQEVDFVVGKNFVITCRYEVVDPIYNLHRALEAEELLSSTKQTVSADTVLERIMGLIYRNVASDVEQVGYRLERIEQAIFSGKERASVRTISDTTRVLLRFETALARHKGPLSDFLSFLGAPAFFGTTFDEHAAHIEAELEHAASLLQSYRNVATELRNTNASLLTASQNRIIQILTVFSFVSYAPMIVAAIFTLNATNHMPIVGMNGDFWIVTGLMGAAALLFLLVARLNRWF